MVNFETLMDEHTRWLWMSVVGSQNYGTADEQSDTDVKVAYLPPFDEFFDGQFKTLDLGGPDCDVDVTVHPAHVFLKHAFKGNMNFWEVFYSETLEMNFPDQDLANFFLKKVQWAVRANVVPNLNAMLGMAVQKDKGVIPCWVDPPIRKTWKSAQHAMRMLDTVEYYLETGKLCLNLLRHGEYEWADWKSRVTWNQSDYDYYTEMWNEKFNRLDSLRNEKIEYFNNDGAPLVAPCREDMEDAINILKTLVKGEIRWELHRR